MNEGIRRALARQEKDPATLSSFAFAAQSRSSKVRSIAELGAIAQSFHDAGKRVVLCHGTFDLMHIGHVRHLEAARRLGDVLFVTITADAFVNKGPGRPVFHQYLRSEMLAHLNIVDWIGINYAPDAINVIREIRPTFYVKGQDYKNPEGDVTGKIVLERATAEECGGKLVFTEEIQFSSSELINRHLNVFDPQLQDHLDLLRVDKRRDEIFELLERASQLRVLIVGETIIDEYRYVLPLAKAAKENIIATRLQDVEVFAGGVIAAANVASGFCAEVDIVTVLGGRDSHEQQIRQALHPRVEVHAVRQEAAPTIRKCRYVDPTQLRKLFEVYYIDDAPIAASTTCELDEMIAEYALQADVVISNDFGHGMIGPSTVKVLTEKAKYLAVTAQSNSANMGFNLITKYPRADFVCLDSLEARLATRQNNIELTEIINHHLPALIDCPVFVVTHGRHGCVTYQRDGLVHSIPAVSPRVVDTMGAGDAFLAVAAPLASLGASADIIGFVGNVVGALKVGIVGHRQAVDKMSVMRAITTLLK